MLWYVICVFFHARRGEILHSSVTSTPRLSSPYGTPPFLPFLFFFSTRCTLFRLVCVQTKTREDRYKFLQNVEGWGLFLWFQNVPFSFYECSPLLLLHALEYLTTFLWRGVGNYRWAVLLVRKISIVVVFTFFCVRGMLNVRANVYPEPRTLFTYWTTVFVPIDLVVVSTVLLFVSYLLLLSVAFKMCHLWKLCVGSNYMYRSCTVELSFYLLYSVVCWHGDRR